MKKVGIDFFPYPSTNDVNVTTILGDFGAMGVYAYTILLQVIYKDKGFYFEPNKRNLSTLRLLGGIDRDSKIIEEVIESALELGLFDSEKYKEFGILTSEEIQSNYFVAVRKRKDVEINKEFLIGKNIKTYEEIIGKSGSEKAKKSGSKEKTAEFLSKTAEEKGKTAEDLNRKYNIIGENKIEENKIQKNIIEENTHTRERRIEESGGGDVSLSCVGEKNKINKSTLSVGENVVIVQDVGELLYSELSAIEQKRKLRELTQAEVDAFKQEFEGKTVKRAMYLVSEDFEMEKMIKEIKLSDFLRQSGNLSLSWLLINSEKVLRGDYRTHSKTRAKVESSEGSSVAKLLASIQL